MKSNGNVIGSDESSPNEPTCVDVVCGMLVYDELAVSNDQPLQL